MADLETYYRDLMAGKRSGLGDKALLGLLRLSSRPYAAILRLRALGYRLGLIPSHRLPRPVISVGNLVLGGTGKTPTVAWLAAYLMKQGKRVCVLSRGYGGSAEGEIRIVCDGDNLLVTPEEAGDEPCQLAGMLPGLMVVIGSNRYRAGLHALEKLNPDVFILDDGYQHLKLKRDLNILLLDATTPFDNGLTLPGGFLREAPAAAGRADLVICTRATEGKARTAPVPGKPTCWTKHRLSGMIPLGAGPATGFEAAQGPRVMAFSGIANPAAFFDGLEAVGVRPVTTLSFPDHVSYGEPEIAAILRLKTASRSTVLLTTQKDAVKLLPHADKLAGCFAVVLELEFEDSRPLEAALTALL
ncbi:tetraacyldisaccharide 4'-kinase [Geomonas paludis]|uniref:Tetraacyldisaccharide 4'-kinase n=2 Tax=Geomonas paludis TaxID=2740185 RepID=A0A6V8MZ56_9BACT|nr:tetraacyldisaccharide 4'-kinase [Geomonas paludis]UPU36865.1 tetraacyldisaccharide 4'-kinase [Geomonas paludis]GFO65535.1 tetraacyldisaccharide 4'-kinase [Geomonas paludis]